MSTVIKTAIHEADQITELNNPTAKVGRYGR